MLRVKGPLQANQQLKKDISISCFVPLVAAAASHICTVRLLFRNDLVLLDLRAKSRQHIE
jgi:hypothetical protein